MSRIDVLRLDGHPLGKISFGGLFLSEGLGNSRLAGNLFCPILFLSFTKKHHQNADVVGTPGGYTVPPA